MRLHPETGRTIHPLRRKPCNATRLVDHTKRRRDDELALSSSSAVSSSPAPPPLGLDLDLGLDLEVVPDYIPSFSSENVPPSRLKRISKRKHVGEPYVSTLGASSPTAQVFKRRGSEGIFFKMRARPRGRRRIKVEKWGDEQKIGVIEDLRGLVEECPYNPCSSKRILPKEDAVLGLALIDSFVEKTLSTEVEYDWLPVEVTMARKIVPKVRAISTRAASVAPASPNFVCIDSRNSAPIEPRCTSPTRVEIENHVNEGKIVRSWFQPSNDMSSSVNEKRAGTRSTKPKATKPKGKQMAQQKMTQQTTVPSKSQKRREICWKPPASVSLGRPTLKAKKPPLRTRSDTSWIRAFNQETRRSDSPFRLRGFPNVE